MLDLVAQIPFAPLWAASTRPIELSPIRIGGRGDGSAMANFIRAAQKITNLKIWASVASGVDARVEATANTESDATGIRDAFKGAVGIARLYNKDDQPQMLKFYDGLTASSSGRLIQIQVQEPFDSIDTLLANLPSFPEHVLPH